MHRPGRLRRTRPRPSTPHASRCATSWSPASSRTRVSTPCAGTTRPRRRSPARCSTRSSVPTGRSLAAYLGSTATHVDAGVAVGMQRRSRAARSAQVAGYAAEGYRSMKLKIAPGHDVDVVAAVRAEVGPSVTLQVDANGSYALDRRRPPRAARRIRPGVLRTAARARRAPRPRAPRRRVCARRSVSTRRSRARRVARDAIELGACRVVSIKAGLVGGLDEARRTLDVCRAAGVAARAGGMLETGVGRAALVALASLPGFTVPGDLSASSRYFVDDVTEPFELDDGRLAVPTGPGLGVTPRPELLAALHDSPASGSTCQPDESGASLESASPADHAARAARERLTPRDDRDRAPTRSDPPGADRPRRPGTIAISSSLRGSSTSRSPSIPAASTPPTAVPRNLSIGRLPGSLDAGSLARPRAAPTARSARPRRPPPRCSRRCRAATGSRRRSIPRDRAGTSRSGRVIPAPIALRYASFAVHSVRNARTRVRRLGIEPLGVLLGGEHPRRQRVESRARSLDLDVDADSGAGDDGDHRERFRVRQAEREIG